jgi:hypothetical protein
MKSRAAGALLKPDGTIEQAAVVKSADDARMPLAWPRRRPGASKAAVQAAPAKALKLGEPETLIFWADADKMTVARRAEKKARQSAALRDLTA